MTPETQTTISVALSQMYDKGIDHAIDIVNDSMFDDKTMLSSTLINTVLNSIIVKLQNLKAKG